MGGGVIYIIPRGRPNFPVRSLSLHFNDFVYRNRIYIPATVGAAIVVVGVEGHDGRAVVVCSAAGTEALDRWNRG